MGTNIELKDLYNEEQTYEDIGTVAVPRSDGSGNEYYVKRPVINYTLLDPPTHEIVLTQAQDIFAWNAGDGTILGVSDDGNFFGGAHAAVAGKTTQPILSIIAWKHLTGVTVNSGNRAHIIYLYEELAGSVLQEVVSYVGSTDFTAQVGWGQLLLDDNNSVTGYAKIDDPSAVSIGIEQPNAVINADIFYSLLSEVMQEEQSVSVTENGTQTIVPMTGKSGIRKLTLSVNVPSSGGKLQEKAVTFTANGTQEVTPDEGYDGMSKLTATVNVEGGDSDYYLLQNPTGTMPTYPNSSKTFAHTDAVIASGFQPYIYSFGNANAMESYGVPTTTMIDFRFKEPTADSFANRILFINSAAVATLSQDVLQMFLGSSWTFGAMTLAAGWNVCTFTVDGSGTTTEAACTATTIDAINMTLRGYGGIPKNNFDWAAMDAYTLSFFKDAAGTAGADSKSWVFTNGVASISQADFNKYLAPGVIAAVFINVPLEPVGGTGYSQMQNVMRSESSDGSAQLVFAGEEYSLDETSDPKILTPTVGGFGIISRASADADFVLSYVNAYGNTITSAFTSNGVQVTLYAQLLQL